MTTTRSKTTIIASSITIFGLIGPLIFWLNSYQGQSSRAGSQKNVSYNLPARMSLGDRILITADNNPDKQAGVQFFKAGKFTEAIAKFNDSLQLHRNDPETWIYLNNAMAQMSGKTIKIAVTVPIGGNLNVAKEILRGVAQLQYEVNHSRPIQGKLMQVEISNDDNDPEVATQIAKELVKDSKILAVIGHNSSDATFAAAPIYQQSGVVMISPTSVANNLTSIGNYIFRTTPSSRVIADTLSQYVVKSLHKKKIAICTDSKAKASESFKEDFIAATFQNGGRVTHTTCDFSSASFSPSDIPSQAISDGADALLLLPSVNRIQSAAEVIRANHGRLTLLGSHTMYTFETLQQGQADANNMVMAVSWHPTAMKGNAFSANAKKLWGGSGSWRTAMSYDATKVIAVALNSGLSRDQLQKAMSNSGFLAHGATGDVQFLPSGDRNQLGMLVRVQPGNESGTGYDFKPILPPSTEASGKPSTKGESS
ncbi:MAG: ABC transporter substrate-binding protein [Acaryochloridaceae cyanobacterium CSU_3_4]|nr:ABC transporter substrate-binding protein [Acaryochloridaceae cyanobacterium CSU_3_4]